jgi:hypothetical protein
MRVTCRIGESGDLEGLLDQTIETRVTVASRLCLSPLALYSHCEWANTRPLGLSPKLYTKQVSPRPEYYLLRQWETAFPLPPFLVLLLRRRETTGSHWPTMSPV